MTSLKIVMEYNRVIVRFIISEVTDMGHSFYYFWEAKEVIVR